VALSQAAKHDAPVRIVLGKLGLDGHDRGVRMLARELRERGCEIVLLPTGITAEMIAAVARDEDADVIGISILSGAHMTLVPRLLQEVAQTGTNTPVLCGGTISPADAAELLEQGVRVVSPVGTPVTAAADMVIDAALTERRQPQDPGGG
jgi:methylmalonyl-CoA mutase C-terminal domain/subunit